MRLLALMTDAFGGGGGIAEYNRNWVRALAADPFRRIDILTRLPPETAVQPFPGVSQAHPGRSTIAFAWAVLRQALATPRPDCLFCGHINFFPLTALIGRLTGLPIWLQIHGIDAWSAPVQLRPSSLRQAALITAVSDYTRRRFLGWAPVAPERIEVVPNTLDERVFTPAPRPLDLARNLGLTDERIILTVGRLNAAERYKGQDRIIDLMPRLLEQDPRIRYLIAGDGDDRSRLEQRAEDLGVAGKVRFLGKVPQESLPDLYRLANLFVLAGFGEGFGIVLLEAMACSTPVVASSRDGSREAVMEGKLGAVVDPEDSDALFGTILSGLSSPRGTPQGLDAFRFPAFRKRMLAAMNRCCGSVE